MRNNRRVDEFKCEREGNCLKLWENVSLCGRNVNDFVIVFVEFGEIINENTLSPLYLNSSVIVELLCFNT